MLDIELDAEGIEKAIAGLDRADVLIERKMHTTMEAILVLLEGLAVDITHRKQLVNFGMFVGGIQADTVRGSPHTGMHGALLFTAPHSEFVDQGRKPGRPPPPAPIELWVRRKLGISDDDKVREVAFLIARAIGHRGTIARFGGKGGDVLKDTKREGEPRAQMLWRGMGRDLAAEIARLMG